MKIYLILIVLLITIVYSDKAILEEIYTGLGSITAIKSVTLPGESHSRLIVVEQQGLVKIETNLGLEPIVDIRSLVTLSGAAEDSANPTEYSELGLLGIAIHKEFISNSLIYLYYTTRREDIGPVPPNCFSRKEYPLAFNKKEYNFLALVEEWKVDINSLSSALSRTILKVRQPYLNNNGLNNLFIFPNGNLGVGLGDGGCNYDPFEFAQNKDALLGKILVVNIVTLESFISCNKAVSFFSEIKEECPALYNHIGSYAEGVRNPTSFSFDFREDDEENIYFADGGSNATFQEMNVLIPSSDYGWVNRIGDECTCLLSDTNSDNLCSPYNQTLSKCITLQGDDYTPAISGLDYENTKANSIFTAGVSHNIPPEIRIFEGKLLFGSGSRINNDFKFPRSLDGYSELRIVNPIGNEYDDGVYYSQNLIEIDDTLTFLSSIYHKQNEFSNGDEIFIAFSNNAAPLLKNGKVNNRGMILKLVGVCT